MEAWGAGEPGDGGWGPRGVKGARASFPAHPGPSRLWAEMGNTLGLAPMAALPRRSPRREEPLPNPGSFDELHRLCKGERPLRVSGGRGRGGLAWGAQRWERESEVTPLPASGGRGAAVERSAFQNRKDQFLPSAGCARTGPASQARGPSPCLPLPPPAPADVFPGQMEGVKLVVNKVLSSHFQVPPLP